MPNFDIGSLDTYESEDKLFSKHIITVGDTNLRPNEGAICIVNIKPLDDIDISELDLGLYKFNDSEITIGEGDSLFAEFFDKVLLSMYENEKAYIKSNIDIDGQSINKLMNINDALMYNKDALKFHVHLKSVSRAASVDELLTDEKLEIAEHNKEKGTEIYSKNKLSFSISRFKRALFYLDKINAKYLTSSQTERFKALSTNCNLNLAAAFLKTNEYKAVIEHCDKGLLIEPTNTKGHFRKGQALAKMHNYKEAIDSFQNALSFDKNNKTILIEMQKVKQILQKEKDMYKKMFPIN